MKLYFSPGACSLAPHILLNEAGYKYDTEKVDLASHKTAAGGDFYGTNPKGYVPALTLDDGQLLTEVQVILQYVADHKPQTNLLPKPGTIERYRALEWLNFIATELHKGFSPLFRPTTPEDYKTVVRGNLAKKLELLDKHLAGKQFVLGNAFSAVDAYAFTILRWGQYTQVDLTPYANITAYMGRMMARPQVQAALDQEGIKR